MDAHLKIPETSRTFRQYGTEGFRDRPELGSYYAEGREPLGQPMIIIPIRIDRTQKFFQEHDPFDSVIATLVN